MQLNPNKNKPEQDIVYTPRDLALDIIQHYNPTGRILDPSCGDGAFLHQFPGSDTDWCELEQGRDFLDLSLIHI